MGDWPNAMGLSAQRRSGWLCLPLRLVVTGGRQAEPRMDLEEQGDNQGHSSSWIKWGGSECSGEVNNSPRFRIPSYSMSNIAEKQEDQVANVRRTWQFDLESRHPSVKGLRLLASKLV